MKTIALFLSLTLATTLVLADECTTEDLTEISNVYSSAMNDGIAACPDLTTANDATAADYCNSDCLDFMSSMLDDLPDCSSSGINIKEGLQAAMDYCETGTADTSDILTGSSSSLLRTGSSASTKADSTTTDKVTADTVPPATKGSSSSASSIGMTFASAAVTTAALIVSLGL